MLIFDAAWNPNLRYYVAVVRCLPCMRRRRALPLDQTSPQLDESGADPRLANGTSTSATVSVAAGGQIRMMPVVVGQPYESSDDEMSGSDSEDSNAYVVETQNRNPKPKPRSIPNSDPNLNNSDSYTLTQPFAGLGTTAATRVTRPPLVRVPLQDVAG